MYDNIGGKIKGLAKASFIVAAIAEVITGIALMAADEDLIGYGLLVMFVGPIVAWVSSWLLYGFGQLIENSDIIAKQPKRENDKYEKAVAAREQKRAVEEQKRAVEEQKKKIKVAKDAIANLEFDEDGYIDITCANCKAELSFTKGQLQSGEELTCPMCDTPISV